MTNSVTFSVISHTMLQEVAPSGIRKNVSIHVYVHTHIYDYISMDFMLYLNTNHNFKVSSKYR